MEKMIENASQVEAKENWAKPELETVCVKESTLAGNGATPDALLFS
ncbi:hypothetical protein [Aquirufa nivalisilvae]|nr:hypothetical protein [Aquirufa nivalisilvae]